MIKPKNIKGVILITRKVLLGGLKVHIPDGFLDLSICAVTYLATLIFWIFAFRRATFLLVTWACFLLLNSYDWAFASMRTFSALSPNW